MIIIKSVIYIILFMNLISAPHISLALDNSNNHHIINKIADIFKKDHSKIFELNEELSDDSIQELKNIFKILKEKDQIDVLKNNKYIIKKALYYGINDLFSKFSEFKTSELLDLKYNEYLMPYLLMINKEDCPEFVSNVSNNKAQAIYYIIYFDLLINSNTKINEVIKLINKTIKNYNINNIQDKFELLINLLAFSDNIDFNQIKMLFDYIKIGSYAEKFFFINKAINNDFKISDLYSYVEKINKINKNINVFQNYLYYIDDITFINEMNIDTNEFNKKIINKYYEVEIINKIKDDDISKLKSDLFMNLWVKILYLKNQKLFNEIFDKSSNEYNDQKSLTFPKDLLHFLWNNCIKRNEFFSDEIIKQSVNSTKEKFEDHIISKFNETSRIYFDNLNNNFEEYLCDICFKDKGHIFNKLKINKTDIINYFKNLAYISNVEENKVKLKNAGVKLFDQYLIKFNPSGGKHE